MIRWLCEWYLRKFPPKLPEGWYPSDNPWTVAVEIYTDSGTETRYVEFTEDNLWYFTYSENWKTAKNYALNRAYNIAETGYTEWLGTLKVFYPVHRIHSVKAFPASVDTSKAKEAIADVQEVIDNLERTDV